MGDAEIRQVGRDSGGGGEIEFLAQLQAVGGARDGAAHDASSSQTTCQGSRLEPLAVLHSARQLLQVCRSG